MEYKSQNKICQNCKNDFNIEPDDFSFYEKMKVPPPTFCPECRQQRRYVWRNERVFYKRPCDKTGESIISMYAPNNRFPVYSTKEWWGDSWDAKDYAQDIDFSRPFFEQFKELQNKVPRLALLNKNCINSDYCNHSKGSKDCYMCCATLDSDNCMYSSNMLPSKDSIDCYRAEGNGNGFLYECINVFDSYNCQYCFYIENCVDCFYSFDLKNCSNCFLSYNLRGQSYCFLNEKMSKDEYLHKLQEFNLSSYKDRSKLYEKWIDIIFNKALHRPSVIDSSVNSTGNLLFHSKDAKNCFDNEKTENSKYLYVLNDAVDCMDIYHGGPKIELTYESHALSNISNCKFIHLSYDDSNLTYCDSCHNSNELFGCIGVKKGSYMILNKQYNKEDYFELKDKLIEHMKRTGEYGEFFPVDLSPFAYNETIASVYMPLSKEIAIGLGFRWKNDMPGTYNQETLTEIPDTIEEISESIITEILKCEKSSRNYNITKQEFDFYKRLKIPIPRLHPDERNKNRLSIRPDRRLYDTFCSISGVPIKTAYPLHRRPKNIVSDEVYKNEVL